jgi:hypothetical protein
VVDPTATVSISTKDFTATGGTVTQDLSQAVSDANAASAADAALTPTQSVGNLTANTSITGNGGVNVISVQSLSFNSNTLTLAGGANDVFVINVAGNFTFAQSNVVLTGGVTANHVLFYFPTAGGTIDLFKSSNVVVGTFLAPQRSVIYDNPASFTGAIIAQNIDIHSGADLTGATFAVPAGVSGFVFNGTQGRVMPGVQLTLAELVNGQWVNVATTTTAGDGSYSFGGLQSGTSQITETPPAIPPGFSSESTNSSAGTVNGVTDGTSGTTAIGNINLAGGNNGINYDFINLFAGS